MNKRVDAHDYSPFAEKYDTDFSRWCWLSTVVGMIFMVLASVWAVSRLEKQGLLRKGLAQTLGNVTPLNCGGRQIVLLKK